MIFEFVKNAGEKMMNFFSNDADNNTKATKISEFVTGLGLEVNNFAVNVEDDKASLSGDTKTQDTKEKVILAAGNVEGISQVEDKINVETAAINPPQFYTVKSGDTLSKISKEFYKDPMKYNTIFEANRPMLKSADLIYPGQTLRIPTEQDTVLA